jgi:ABC-type branched-subunit amino acid transport system ATPase component
MNSQTLCLRGLTRRFGAVVAVDGIDLDVPAGQMLASSARPEPANPRCCGSSTG